MRRLALIVAVLLVGCSEDEAQAPAAVEDTAPVDTGSGVDTFVEDTGTIADTAMPDTTPADTYDAAIVRDEMLCKTGSPRLEWKTIPPSTEPRCYDTFWAMGGISPSCAFVPAEDGRLRCLPFPMGKLTAAWTDDCSSVGGPRLLEAKLVAADRPGLTMASVLLPTGRYVVRGAEVSTGTTWRPLVEGTNECASTDGTGPYPSTFSDGKAVRVSATVVGFTQFYAGE